jgi:hypothetical protein
MGRDLIYDQWLPYKRYEKQECDIKLKDGKIIKHVYPNAGRFTAVCGKTFQRLPAIPESEVAEIMYKKYYQNDLCNGNCNPQTQ